MASSSTGIKYLQGDILFATIQYNYGGLDIGTNNTPLSSVSGDAFRICLSNDEVTKLWNFLNENKEIFEKDEEADSD